MNAIEVIDLSFVYPDGTVALKNVNFEAKQGTKTAILGSNGSGKSTLLYHFNGLFFPKKRKVLMNGEEIVKKNIDKVRKEVGLVFQDPDDQLFAPSVWDDVAFGPRNLGLSPTEVENRVEETLRMLDIFDLARKSPDNLSGGEKKKAAIAGVLAMEPKILVLDEPTAGLDSQGTTDIIEIMDELNAEGKTIILSTHDSDLASSWADMIYVLQKGRIYQYGTPNQIFSSDNLIKEANLKLPMVVKTYREFKAHGMSNGADEIPLSLLDLLDNLNLNAPSNKGFGSINVILIPRIIDGGGAVNIDLLDEMLKNSDKIGSMGTVAKAFVKKLGIECDYNSDVIQSAISAALRELNVSIFASGGMADLVVKKVNDNNIKNNRTIKCTKMKSYEA